MTMHTLKIAAAFMAVVIGGGLASGNEILQFFTSFGSWSYLGVLVSAVLFGFLGMQVARAGARVNAGSHKEVLGYLLGIRLGWVFDIVLSFFLFGVGVAMLAGSAATFNEQFGLAPLVGGALMATVVAATLCLNLRGIVNAISLVMPLLVAMVLLVTLYSATMGDAELAELEQVATGFPQAAPHWLISAVLYASFNIAVGFPILCLLGGASKGDSRGSGLGGLLGGLGLGALIILLNIGLFTNLNHLVGVEMPTLALASRISPVLGTLMSAVLLCMIYSTAVGMFMAFSSRFATAGTHRFRLISAATCAIGLALSFAGFTTLVGTVYPLLGYLGFALIIALLVSWWRMRNTAASQA